MLETSIGNVLDKAFKEYKNSLAFKLGPLFIQGYSQMEVANATSVLSKKQHIEAIEKGLKEWLKSCGMPVLISQVKIVDGDNQNVGIGKTGELIIRGTTYDERILAQGQGNKRNDIMRQVGFVGLGMMGNPITLRFKRNVF